MKSVIVTTTINPPTEAIRKFEALRDWDLIVIGDLNTPKDYRLWRGIYLDPPAIAMRSLTPARKLISVSLIQLSASPCHDGCKLVIG